MHAGLPIEEHELRKDHLRIVDYKTDNYGLPEIESNV